MIRSTSPRPVLLRRSQELYSEAGQLIRGFLGLLLPKFCTGRESCWTKFFYIDNANFITNSNDANLKAAATVGTILVGANSNPNILVSYQDYEDATNTTCSPSYLFSSGAPNQPFGPTFGTEITGAIANGKHHFRRHTAFSEGILNLKFRLDCDHP